MSDSPSRSSGPVVGVVLVLLLLGLLWFWGNRPPSGVAAVVPPAVEPRSPAARIEPAPEAALYDAPEFAGLPGWLPLLPVAASAVVEEQSLRSDGLSEGRVAFAVESDPAEAVRWLGEQAARHGMTAAAAGGAYASGDGHRALEISSAPASAGRHRVVVEFRDRGEGCACPTCGGEAE